MREASGGEKGHGKKQVLRTKAESLSTRAALKPTTGPSLQLYLKVWRKQEMNAKEYRILLWNNKNVLTSTVVTATQLKNYVHWNMFSLCQFCESPVKISLLGQEPTPAGAPVFHLHCSFAAAFSPIIMSLTFWLRLICICNFFSCYDKILTKKPISLGSADLFWNTGHD